MKYTTEAYLITCLTNMHVGSGGANYGVIDNLVQRDPVNNMPTINSSSLKGALREYFKNIWNENDVKLNYIFGSDGSSNRGNENGKEGIGHYKFFNADLLVLPVRSNKKPFFRATAQMLVDTINTKAKAFGVTELTGNYNKTSPTVKESLPNLRLEDWSASTDTNLNTDSNMGNDVAIFNDDTFKILAKKLPVIARNQLDNGTSKNLWYEEVVPRESRFIFFVSRTDKYSDEFETALNNKIVQIGANASIGYGYCKITKL